MMVNSRAGIAPGMAGDAPLIRLNNGIEVTGETKRILESGIMAGGRFILREGNNLAPEISVANVAAMYDAALRFSSYETDAA